MAHRDFSYCTRGIYIDQIEKWFVLFLREHFHFIIPEELFADERTSFDAVCDFMGVARQADIDFTPFNSRSYADIQAEVTEFYRPYNLRLAERLGRELPWS